MHISLDAVWLRTGYEPALDPDKEAAGFAELDCK
jgi:hypothetical protein